MNLEKLLKRNSNNPKKDPALIFKIAQSYEYGRGCQADLKEAKRWYRKALNQGYADAGIALAELYEDDWNSKRSQQLAFKYTQQAFKLGSIEAISLIAWKYYYGDGVTKSRYLANKWFENAARKGDVSALIELVSVAKNKKKTTANTSLVKLRVNQILATKKPDLILKLAFLFCHDGIFQKEAIKYIKIASKLGSSDADLELAIAYSSGEGIKKNKAQLKLVLDRIYRSKNLIIISKVAGLFDYGEGFEESKSMAFKWYKKAADLGDVYSQLNVGRKYRDGIGIGKSMVKAVTWLEKSAFQKNGSACFSLGYIYRDHDQKVYNSFKSMKFYRKALKYGITNAYSGIGWNFQEGVGVRQSNATAMKWFKKGRDNDDVRSEYALGWMVSNGLGCRQDFEESYRIYKKCADLGYKRAMVGIGYQLEKGLGCRKNINKAIQWYQRGSKLNDADSTNNLASVYLLGKGVSIDGKKAIELYNRASELGSLSATFNLGTEYAYGEYVDKNEKLARKYWKKSIVAQPPNASGQIYFKYGIGHLRGICNLRKKDAVKWLIKSSEKNYPESFELLGRIYREGWTVPKNIKTSNLYYKKAIWLYKKELEKGCHNRLNQLALFYTNGWGVSQSHKLAKKYFQRALELKILSHNNIYSWLLSTSKNVKVREGRLACTLAKRAIKEYGEKAVYLDTLAAGYAESGKFSLAIKYQSKAIEKLPKKDSNEMKGYIDRLYLYQKDKPWRE